MAQRSKKDYIIRTALPLFLENGFKGTSIDLVVRQSKVSKPTVYNHFPDKAALMFAVLEQWIQSNLPDQLIINDIVELENAINCLWLSAETVSFYALVIGEGRRFPDAKKIFWALFDDSWRLAIMRASNQAATLTQQATELLMDRQLLLRLKQF